MKTRDKAVGEKLDWYILHDDGTAYDLTGYTCTLLVDNDSARAMTVPDAANGVARYTTVASDFKAGKHAFRIKITTGATLILYTDEGTLEVEEVKQ